MPRRLIKHYGKSTAVLFTVPSDLDYWTCDGKRINFRAKRLNNFRLPGWTGFNVIIWIFNLHVAWKKRDV